MELRSSRIVTSVVCILLSFGVGCGVTFRFGPGPKGLERLSALDRCVFKHRIVLRPASASYTQGKVISDGRATSRAGRGYTFYRGTRRIDATRALKLLREPRLEADYRRIWKREKRLASVLLHTGGTLLGSVMLFGLSGGLTLGSALNQPKTSDGSSEATTQRRVGIALLAVAGAALLVSPLLLGYGYHYARITKSHSTIFIATPALLTRLRRALAAYEDKVKTACRKRVLGPR